MATYEVHPKEGMVWACPHCDNAGNIYERTGDYTKHEHRFYCQSCGESFDERIEREAKQTGGGRVGPNSEIGRKLEAMDPDDLPAGGRA